MDTSTIILALQEYVLQAVQYKNVEIRKSECITKNPVPWLYINWQTLESTHATWHELSIKPGKILYSQNLSVISPTNSRSTLTRLAFIDPQLIDKIQQIIDNIPAGQPTYH
jgi:hypothetical protein